VADGFDKIISMKLRTAGNSIRLRLSQSDVRKFTETGVVEEFVRTGVGEDEMFSYRLLRSKNDSALSAKFSDRCLQISVPLDQASDWVTSERVGIEADQPLSAGEVLSILIEKDFACLTPRSGDDDSDTFPNPAAAATC